jgi:outer membrane protein TolC
MKLNIILFSFLFVSMNLFSEDTLDQELNKVNLSKLDEKPKKTSGLTIKEIVQRSIEFNPTVRNARYDLAKYDSNTMKAESKYSWKIIGGADINQGKLPFNQNNIFSGTRTQTNNYSLGTEKIFKTGTYFKVEASTRRFDSNAFENRFTTPGGFSAFGIPPLYTGAITATLSQDLVKNSFGLLGNVDKNNSEILKNQAEINKQELSIKLSNAIVQSLVDYWSYSIADSSVKTYEQLLKNTKNIRDLTKQKTSLGLSETFEINQWNALYSQTENLLEKAKLDKEESRRKIIRTLNLTDDSDVGETKDLIETLPSELDYNKDLLYAFQNRGDWINLKKKEIIAEKAMANAKTGALPSFVVSGSYAYTGQNVLGPGDNFTNDLNGIPSFKYHNLNANAKLNYPINDPGVKVDLRDAEILNRQVAFLREDLKKEIEDDIRSRIDAVVVGHKILQNAIKTKKDSESYYNGLLNSFRSGRFTAVAVKNALDTLVQNELSEIQAKINYNINLLRYEVAKNSLLKKYEIDINKYAPEEF